MRTSIICILMTVFCAGCATYYLQPQLPDGQVATICGSGGDFDDRTGNISVLAIKTVDSVIVKKIRTSETDHLHFEPIKLLPGKRILELVYVANLSGIMGIGDVRINKEPILVNMNAIPGHKYEAKFHRLRNMKISCWIEDQQTKENQGGPVDVTDGMSKTDEDTLGNSTRIAASDPRIRGIFNERVFNKLGITSLDGIQFEARGARDVKNMVEVRDIIEAMAVDIFKNGKVIGTVQIVLATGATFLSHYQDMYSQADAWNVGGFMSKEQIIKYTSDIVSR